MRPHHQFLPTTTLLLLLLATTPITAAFCTNFTVLPQTYTERGSTTYNLTNLTVAAPYTYRVSNALICNATTAAQNPPNTCLGDACLPQPLTGTTIAQPGISNITLSPDDLAAAFDLVSRTADIPFPTQGSTTMGAPGAASFDACVSPTWAGYLTFTPLVNCVNGVFTSCEGAAIPEGTTARMCAPLSHGEQLAGAVFFQQTSDDEANALGPVPDPEVPEEDVVFSQSWRSPSPLPTSVAATMVPGQPGDATATATAVLASVTS